MLFTLVEIEGQLKHIGDSLEERSLEYIFSAQALGVICLFSGVFNSKCKYQCIYSLLLRKL